MSNTYLDKAIEAVPRFAERISLFTKKLRLAQYADSTIYSYHLKISQAVLYQGKLPYEFLRPFKYGLDAYYYFNQPCREMDAHPTPQGHPITKQGGL